MVICEKGVCCPGIQVLVDGMGEALHMPKKASMMMVARSKGGVTCNT
jgi:hypothetical protein